MTEDAKKTLHAKSESLWKQTETDLFPETSTFLNISLVYEIVYTNKLQPSYIFINKELKDGNTINANQICLWKMYLN